MLIDKNSFEKYGLTQDDLNLTMSKNQPGSYRANEFFLKEGQVSNHLGFVIKGILRSYIYDDFANEITQQFYPEGSLIISFDSFNNRIPARENIKAIEDSDLMLISFESQNELYLQLPVWREICKDFADAGSHELMLRAREFQTLSATERYRKFCDENPHILQRVTLGHIASYIGVDIATLSRIRKKK